MKLDVMNENIKRYDRVFLIVLYGCPLVDCKTFHDILNILESYTLKNFCICVWNNGPINNEDDHHFIKGMRKRNFPHIDLTYVETPENRSLAIIYNFFLSHFASDGYAIFDHDSGVSEEYVYAICSNASKDVIVPHIFSAGAIRGPVLDGKILSEDVEFELNQACQFISIGSGIFISQACIGKFQDKYSRVFDENYALYGVDTTFWLRATRLALETKISVACISVLNHSLSRLEDESPRMIAFRQKERGLDVGITLRNYFSTSWLLRVVKIVAKRPLLRRPISSEHPSLIWLAIGVIVGTHPRCKELDENLKIYE